MALQLPVIQMVGGARAAGDVADDKADDLTHAVAQVVTHMFENVRVKVAGFQLVWERMPFHWFVSPWLSYNDGIT